MMINITKQFFFCIGLICKKFFVLLIWALGGMYHIARYCIAISGLFIIKADSCFNFYVNDEAYVDVYAQPKKQVK